MKRLGIVGGGQLGRMLTQAAQPLGFTVTVLDPTPNSPAGQVADKQIVGDFTDAKAIKELAQESDFLTFEIELANAEALDELTAKGMPINPTAKTLAMIKDKYLQKQFLREAGVPVADFAEVGSKKDLEAVVNEFGYPFLLKAKKDAYDGRGNALIESEKDIEPALEKLDGRELYAERLVPFTKELSAVVARSSEGEIVPFPVVETIHRNNICHIVIGPAPIEPAAAKQATELAKQVMQHLEGAGVFGIEMFLTEDGEVLVNEIAPRVHNSGHHTIEATETSQFEQHVRAVTGMPLGSSKQKVPAAVMINILGERQGPAKVDGIQAAKKLGDVHVHVYGKAETKPERKMGHITVTTDTPEEARRIAEAARKHISI